uniref:TPR_REGION domain-containing protein n=1 Tax=Mesocestoides corti TaxID=53468 RepID=A0A5K3FLI9_MESCO
MQPPSGQFSLSLDCDSTKLGESPCINSDESGTAKLSFSINLNTEEFGITRLLNNPIIVSLNQAFKVGGRRKEKVKTIGACTIDSFQEIWDSLQNYSILHTVTLDGSEANEHKELEYLVVFEPSFYGHNESFKWLKITVGDLFVLPEDAVNNNQFVATFRNHVSSDNKPIICSKSVVLKQNGFLNRKNRKWATLQDLEDTLEYLPNKESEETPNSNYISNNEELKILSRCQNFVRWNQEWRQLLRSEDTLRLKERLSLCPYLPVEIVGCSLQGKSWSVENTANMHGVALVDISQLLCPGVTCVKSQCKVKHFDPGLLDAKRIKEPSLVPDAIEILSNLNAHATARRTSKSKSTLSSERTEVGRNESAGSAGIDFNQVEAWLTVEICLSEALIPARTKASAVADVAAVLEAARPDVTPNTDLQKPIIAFKNSILEMVSGIFSHVRPPFEDYSTDHKQDCNIPSSIEWNTYLDFQKHLRFPIAASVAKEFTDLTEASLQEAIQKFLNDLQVYLLKETRKALRLLAGRCLETEDAPAVGGLSEVNLRIFAQEAEFFGNLSWANYYLQNLMAINSASPENLLLISSFYARQNKLEEAVQCLRRCLSVEPNNLQALVNLGIVLAGLVELDAAKRILEDASDIHNSSATVWIILAVFYELIDDNWNRKRALDMLSRLRSSHGTNHSPGDCESQSEIGQPDHLPKYEHCTELVETIDWLLELNAFSFADRGLARLLIHLKEYRSVCTNPGSEDCAPGDLRLPNHVPRSSRCYRSYMNDLAAYHRQAARLLMRCVAGPKQHCKAELELRASVEAQPESAESWCWLGRLRCLQTNWTEAIKCFETAQQLQTWPVRQHRLVQMQLARCYLDSGLFQQCKMQFLDCCSQQATSESWKGVGLACYRLNELEEAQVAFEESNRLNNRDAEVWAYLAILCLKANKPTHAEMCLHYVNLLGLTNESIRAELQRVKADVSTALDDESC